jgi:RNA polymerase sigma-32 factor
MAPGSNIQAYLNAVSDFPLLTLAEEQELGRRLFLQQDLDAARQLVMAHLRFVGHIARSYAGYGLPLSDLIQEGNIGLMKAVKRFNPDVGVRLVTFARYWVRAEIHEFILRNWRIVKVATTKAQRKLFFNLRSQKKRLGWLSGDEVVRVAEDLGVQPREVREMESRLSGQDVGFDAADDDDEDAVIKSPVNFLEDFNYDPARQFENSSWGSAMTGNLEVALANLDERSREIIHQRWLVDDKATLQDLAERYGVSAERIRQLEKNALAKVKLAMQTA